LDDQTEDAGDSVVTINQAKEKYLREVKATKGKATLNAYKHDLRLFRTHCEKHYVTQLTRDDIIALFGAGRDQESN
jgi:site-specific recombinase XerD